MHMPRIVTHLQSLYWVSRDKDSDSLTLPSSWVLDPWETLPQCNQWLLKDSWSHPLASTSMHAQVCSPAHITENESCIYTHTHLYIFTQHTHIYLYILDTRYFSIQSVSYINALLIVDKYSEMKFLVSFNWQNTFQCIFVVLLFWQLLTKWNRLILEGTLPRY